MQRFLQLILLGVCFLAVNVEAACESKDTVALQLKWYHQAQFAGYVVAEGMGFYEEACITISIRPGGPSIDAVVEVIEGRADVGIHWVGPLMAAFDQGQNITLISQVFERAAMVHVTWADDNIDSFPEFTDQDICQWLYGNEYNLLATFAKYDMVWDNDYSDSREPGSSANIIAESFTMNQFLDGDCIAAAAMRYNELAQVLETEKPSGGLYTLDDLGILDYNVEGTALMEDALFVAAPWLAVPHNKDVLRRFLFASYRGWQYARDFPDEAISFFTDDGAHQRWQMHEVSKLIWPSTLGVGVVEDYLLNRTAETCLRYNLVQSPVDLERFRDYTWALEAHEDLAALSPSDPTYLQWGETQYGPGSSDFFATDIVYEDIKFCIGSDGVLVICPYETTEAEDSWANPSDPPSIVISFFLALSLAFMVTMIAFIGVYRNEEVMRRASITFCTLMCFGGIVGLLGIIPAMGKPTDSKCNARNWLVGLGFIAFYGSFLVKTFRIHRIFNTRSLVVVSLRDKDLILRLAGMMVGEAVLLAVLQTLGDVHAAAVVDPNDFRVHNTQCVIDNSGGMITIIYIYNGVLLLYGLYLAFKVSGVSSEFNESRFLGFSIYNLTIVCLIVLPLINGAIDVSGVTQFVLKSAGLIVAVVVSTAVLLLPKVLICVGIMKAPVEKSSNTGSRKSGSGTSHADSVSDTLSVLHNSEAFKEMTPEQLKAVHKSLVKAMKSCEKELARYDSRVSLQEVTADKKEGEGGAKLVELSQSNSEASQHGHASGSAPTL